ncbi:nucleotide-binding domain-containing protein [Lactarius hatsudake]|nr:nucleotide-binding domain-containing protein [Lactarius hatsudake]
MSQTHVVILGAGVIGLTIAHVLTEDAGFKVTIVARDMPEDLTSQAFASPWAGADWSPLTSDDRLLSWEKHTFDKFWSMIPTGLARGLPFRIYSKTENVDSLKASQWKGIVRNFRVLPGDYPWPPKAKSGVQFDTYSVNPDVYLPWLKSQLEGRGVSFVRRLVSSLDEASELAGEGGAIINATSLGARSLLGVEDTKVFPIRGQVVLVHAPNVNDCVSIFPEDTPEVTYVIPRASTPGMVLLGGTAQPNNWDTSVSIPTARGILARAKELVPALAEPTTRIEAHNVGLRPGREGGPRVEAQFVELPSEDALVPTLSKASGKTGKIRSVLVVHAYGFGLISIRPAGYQQSWGAAEEAVRLLKENSPK